jgi:hypothetical protein
MLVGGEALIGALARTMTSRAARCAICTADRDDDLSAAMPLAAVDRMLR